MDASPSGSPAPRSRGLEESGSPFRALPPVAPPRAGSGRGARCSPHLLALLLSAAPLLAGCSDGGPTGEPDPDPDPDPPGALALETVASGLAAPLLLTAPAGDPRLFIVEQPGRIRVVKGGALLPTPFLDLTDRVESGGERGLLGLAFHPRYGENGFLYVNYTDRQGATQVVRFRVRPDDPDRADPTSARTILSIPQPFSNHNGGHLAFAPDGMLWIGTGDGGSGGDPQNQSQNPSTLLGAMLRIDVDGGDPYAIPAGNPFAGGGGRPEIWATGLRNPWRWAFDPPSGNVYIADVGQNRWEEVNVAPLTQAGVNYGWRLMEGPDCYNPASGCNRTGLHLPVLSYGRADGCSITGGFVYRGDALPALRGHYLYGDYCQGWVRSFRYQAGPGGGGQGSGGGQAADPREWFRDLGRILSFGEDGAGELYVLTQDGRVRRVVAGG